MKIQGRGFKKDVPLVMRSVIGQRNSERYNANNTRKTESNVSYRSYTQGPMEEEVWKSYRNTGFSTKCIENEIRRFSFSPLIVFPECSRFHLVTFIV